MKSYNGYVFINKDGQYAKVVHTLSHGGQRERIDFVTDLCCATVFFNHIAERRFHCLRDCQKLKARSTVVVELGHSEEVHNG